MTKFFRLFFIFYFFLTLQQASAQQWGWATLIAPTNSTTVTMLDTNSNVIKQWTGLSGSTGYSSYLRQGGDLWRTVRATGASLNGGGTHGRIQKVNWAGTILFDYTISSTTEIAHHDICPMPNGNVLVIVYEVKTAAQVSAAGGPNASRWSEKVLELQPTGLNTANIVWEWHLWDHLMQSADAAKPNYYSTALSHPELLNINYNNNGSDWVHMNGIDYNAALDQIALSSHNLNEMWVIDHSTTAAQAAGHTGGNGGKGGDFLYRWGNPAAYGASGTATLKVVHDAHWVPANCPNANYLVGFNNQGISNSQSCVDLVNPPYAGYNYAYTAGQAYTPSSYTLRQAGGGYSSNMGNSQQFPNGNMLICLATAGTVREVDASGNQLWTYTSSGSIPQASRYERCFIEHPSVVAVTANPTLCSGGSVQLNITPSATNVSSFTYNWFPTTGLSSATAQNPTLSGISASNTYTVTVTTPGGCSTTLSVPVTVTGGPNVSAGSNVTIASGQSTTLTASGGGTYLWSNGATSASTTVSPTSTTTYSVTVTSGGCTSSSSVTVTVQQNVLSATASTNNTNFCVGGSAQLAVNASGGSGSYSYAWSSNPAGFTSTSASPTVSPSVTTNYSVTVTSGTASTTSSVQVAVNQSPTANAGTDANIALGNSTTLTASGGGTYAWSNGATTASTTVSPTTSTTYTVVVTGTNGCTASDQATVTVLNNPLVATISTTNSVICNGDVTQLLAQVVGNTGNLTYAWTSTPAGFESNIADPFINPSETTTYHLVVSDGTSTTTATIQITVNALPIQPTITSNGTALTSSSSSNNQWFFYGSPIDGANGQSYTPTETGSFQVQVQDANGCYSPLSEPIFFDLPNPLSLSITSTAAVICNGDVLQLTAQLTGNTGAPSYSWTSNPAGFESTIADPFINPTETTTYTLVVVNGAYSATATFTVTVNALPAQPNITTVSDATLQSSSATNNQWFFYGSPIDGANGQLYTPTESGSFQVQVQDANGCYSPLSEPIFYAVSGMNDPQKSILQWSISPNPASKSIRLIGLENEAWYEVKLYDLQGKMVLWQQNQPNFVEVGHLASGVYVVALQTADGVSVRKLEVMGDER